MSQYRDIIIEQGESWEMYLYVTDALGNPINLSDSIVSMRMKKSYHAKDYIEFHTDIVDVINGQIKLWLDESETINIRPIRYVYDCIINANVSSDSPIVFRFIEGIVTVTPTAH